MITINGQSIATPSDMELGVFRISKAERTMTGKMVMEVIAIKRKVDLKWNFITEASLKQLLDILETATFHTLVYPDPQPIGGQRTMTVYPGDIKQGRFIVGDAGIRFWTDVTLGLIEQ